MEAFKTFFAGHVRTRKPLENIQTTFYSKDDRQQITYITTAKLIDTFGTLPPVERRIQASKLLATLTGLQATDFYEPKSHKGFLAKCLENARAKLPIEEKRWNWSKKEKVKKKRLYDNVEGDACEEGTSSVETMEQEAAEGCCLGMQECEYCEGLLIGFGISAWLPALKFEIKLSSTTET